MNQLTENSIPIRDLLLALVSGVFVCVSLFAYDKILWFPSVFFGLCFIILIFNVFRSYYFAAPSLKYNNLMASYNEYGNIEYHDWGFIDLEMQNEAFYWKSISTITAYKADLITLDEITLLLKYDNGNTFAITESTPGWEQFIFAIQKDLNIGESWIAAITQPPFKRNETILYKK